MSAKPTVARDAAGAAEACAKYILASLAKTLDREEFATFAVSGGAGPRPMFERLAAAKFAWSRIHIFWVDERCVPPEDDASNYKMARESLIIPAGIPEKNVHRIRGEADPRTAAAEYAEDIRRYFELGSTELPRFDMAHRGIGADGHTASLFPGEPLTQDRDGIAAAVFAPQFNQWRVTLLPGVLLAARNTVVLVTGAEKAEAVQKALSGPADVKACPAQIGAEKAAWFLDAAAAKSR